VANRFVCNRLRSALVADRDTLTAMASHLRIAVSVFFALVAVAFAVLWVRSYYTFTVWECSAGGRYSSVMSLGGHIMCRADPGLIDVLTTEPWQRREGQIAECATYNAPGRLGFYFERGTTTDTCVPYWSLVFAAVTLAFLPWMPWRINRHSELRTLLRRYQFQSC
jgi:hypothetical protein